MTAAAGAVAGFLAIKLLPYTAFCRLMAGSWKRGFVLAALRLALGAAAAFGLVHSFQAFTPYAAAHSRLGVPPIAGSPWLGYLLIFGASRLLLWRFVAGCEPGIGTSRGRLWGWAGGGTAALSFLTDVGGFLAVSSLLGGIC